MARICITDLYVPDDMTAPLLHNLAAIVDEENADLQFEPINGQSPQPSPVDTAVAEAEDIASRSILAPDLMTANLLRSVLSFIRYSK